MRVDTISIYDVTRVCCVAAASSVSVGGIAKTPDGRGLRNAVVSLKDTQTNIVRKVSTSSFGLFSFDSVPTGVLYTISVNSKLYRFTPQQVTPTDNITNLVFNGQE